MDPKDLDHLRKIDPLNSATVLVLLFGAAVSFILGANDLAEQIGQHWLFDWSFAVACLGLAWHFKKLGRLY